jgi:hypothetical protein
VHAIDAHEGKLAVPLSESLSVIDADAAVR